MEKSKTKTKNKTEEKHKEKNINPEPLKVALRPSGVLIVRCGPRSEDPNEIPSTVGPLGYPSEEPVNRAGRSLGMTGAGRERNIRDERVVKPESFGSFSLFDMMEGMFSEDEDGLFSSGEEGGHLALFSFAHPACSPFLQGFLHEEELCKVVLIATSPSM